MTDTRHREDIARLGASLFNRGLTFGATGNISVKLDDGWLMTPTGSTLGNLDPARLTRLDRNGAHVGDCASPFNAFGCRVLFVWH